MDLVLINPPHPYLIDPDCQAPLGLMSIASYLEREGFSVSIANLSRYTVDEAVEKLPEDIKLFGITATSVDYPLCVDLARRLKARNPSARVILGGPHASLCFEDIDYSVFDVVCAGEAENVIVKIVDNIRNNSHSPVYHGSRVRNLDSYPYPARDMMDIPGGRIFAHGKHYTSKHESTNIMASRGCPFSCAFCASPMLWGRHVEKRSIDSIISEVKHVVSAYGIRELRFSDDTINLDGSRLVQLCKELSKLDVFWRCSVRAGISLADMYKYMYDAGCREISPGVESGDQQVLNVLRKGTTVEDNVYMINHATAAGVKVRMLMMSGTPGESKDTPEKNKAFLDRVDFDSVAVKQFRPLPGSRICQYPREFGCKILDKDVSNYNFHFWNRSANGESQPAPVVSVIETDVLSKEALEDNMCRMREYALKTGKANTG